MKRIPLTGMLAALACLAAAPPAPARSAADARLAAFCRRMDTAWAGVRTYQANLKWPNPHSRREEDQGCGLFLFQQPDRWLMEFHTPRFEKYVIKQDTGYVYIQRLKQALRYHLGPEDRAQVGLLVLGQPTTSLRRFYDLSLEATAADRAALGARGPGLVLVPRAGGSLGLKRAVLFVDPATYLPVKVRMQMDSGEDLRMRLEGTRKNAPLHPSVWNIVLPESTYIMDR